MKVRQLADGREQSFALILEAGEEVMSCLRRFAEERSVTAGHFSGLGAFRTATLGYFNLERKDYDQIPVSEQVEILNLTGNLAEKDGKPQVHAHVVVGRSDGSAMGGHLLEGQVRPTLEIVVTDEPTHLRRRTDPETGLALLVP